MSSLILDELNWGGLSSSSLYNTATANGNDIDSILINETINNDGNDTDSIPFALPINDKINNKMHLFYGDCMKLPADAIVIGNYESLSYRGEDNGTLFTLGGPSFENDVNDAESCMTGNSIIVSGGNTVYNHVIFSIGPKYDVNYDETCNHSLWSAYYSALSLATCNDNKPPIKTIAFCCLYLKSKKFPRDKGAHVALRTIRKFVEQPIGNTIEKIIICCNNPEDYAIYHSLMPAYFPRSIDEALQQSNILPDNIGNEWGEIKSKREIKVTAGPRPSLDKDTIKALALSASPTGPIKTGNSTLNVTWKQPRQMTEVITNDDTERILRIIDNEKNITPEEKLAKKYDKLLQKAIKMDLSDIEETNFISIIGTDRIGQSIVLITAAHIKPERIDMDRLLMYIMTVCDDLKSQPYVLIYAYSGVEEEHVPSSEHLNTLFELFSQRYSLHLANFFILHPTVSLRLYLSMPYLSSRLWKSCICIDSIKSLNPYIDVLTIDFPLVVKNYEIDNT